MINKKEWNCLLNVVVNVEFKDKPNMLCMWSNCLRPVVETKFAGVYTCKSCTVTYHVKNHGSIPDNPGSAG